MKLDWGWFLLAGSVINVNIAALMLSIIFRLKNRQQSAYKGDRDAANHLVLPCYMPMFYGVVFLFTAMAVTFLIIFLTISGPFYIVRVIQLQLILWYSIFLVAPVLLAQKSISALSGKRVLVRIVPMVLTIILLWIISTLNFSRSVEFALQILIAVLDSLFPIMFCVALISRVIWCRVQFGSASNRACIMHLLVYSIVHAMFSICYAMNEGDEALEVVMIVSIGILFFLAMNFPVTLYRTFLADTKFWRGLGLHNRGGFRKSKAILNHGAIAHLRSELNNAASADDFVQRESEMNVQTASNQFQHMMNDISDVMIDFAFVEIGPVIGNGASADVFLGTYQSKEVAIKVSAPPEITEEVLNSFHGEAYITSSLDHPNIVKFYGICVKPPEIGMVIEYCSHGHLKGSLKRDRHVWTADKRLMAALQAARAVEYLHSRNIIHRDIKADNFFVDSDWNVKLGDFGESVFKQNYEPGRRMTVLGTVAFMAPELVEGKPVYTEAIDIYALAMAMWEIWTGLDPFGSTDTFSIYSKVMSGERPPIPVNAPAAFNSVMVLAWDQDPGKRPSASEVVLQLEEICATPCIKSSLHCDDTEESSGFDIEAGIELSNNPIISRTEG